MYLISKIFDLSLKTNYHETIIIYSKSPNNMTNKHKKILAIIPARGGSKGIPNKNIRNFNGKPLIAYTIKQAQSLKKYIDRIIVSTESPSIAKVAKKYGAEIPFMRPPNMSKDNSDVMGAIFFTLTKLKKDENYKPDYVLILQTTSPLRKKEDIIRCIKKMENSEADSVITLCPTHSMLFHIDSQDNLIQVNKINLKKTPNRQAMPKGYKLNGCFAYLTKTDTIIKEKTVFPKKTKAVICDTWRSIDLDEPEDWALAEIVYKAQLQIKNIIKKIKKEKKK